MKKFGLILISMVSLIIFGACQGTTTITTVTTEMTTTEVTSLETTTTETPTTTTLSQLDTPIDLAIDNNIVTFGLVDNATKYRLTIYDSESNLFGEYNITSGFDLSLILSVGSFSCTLIAKALGYIDSAATTLVSFQIVDETRIDLLESENMNNNEYITWLGRTYYSETEALKYFYFTASGFEVAFFGTSIDIVIEATKADITSKQAYLVLFIDGEENPLNGTTYIMNTTQRTISVSGLEDGYHTIKLLKRSEASDSICALKQIQTDGYFTTPPQQKSFSIQYIAASSSAGFGNLGSLSDPKTTANSDGLRAYAYLTSYLLDANTSIFSASGWGVTRGWNTMGQINETQNIPNAFTHIAIDDTNTVFEEGTWDFTDYIPDVIVVNLGTNDFNASGYTSMSTTEKEAMASRFITDYVNFLVVLNNYYPNAKIIVAYGLMNEASTLGAITLEVINQANTTIGSTVVYEFLMEAAGSNSNPYGCSYHPNIQTSMNVAEALAEFISQITGREVVREMIAYE